jgi:hypothetical protein
LGPAQTPEARELSRQDVKKTGNGGIALHERRFLQIGTQSPVGAGLLAMAV